MRYANFCTKCGAKASGRFCAKCGSEIYVMDDSTDNNNASEKEKYQGLKMAGFKYHRVGMSMGKYLTVIPREKGFDVVESSNNIPWPDIDWGTLFGMTGMMNVFSYLSHKI